MVETFFYVFRVEWYLMETYFAIHFRQRFYSLSIMAKNWDMWRLYTQFVRGVPRRTHYLRDLPYQEICLGKRCISTFTKMTLKGVAKIGRMRRFLKETNQSVAFKKICWDLRRPNNVQRYGNNARTLDVIKRSYCYQPKWKRCCCYWCFQSRVQRQMQRECKVYILRKLRFWMNFEQIHF